MKQHLGCLQDKLLLRKRALIKFVNDRFSRVPTSAWKSLPSYRKLKNIGQIEHSRHRSPFNFLVNLLMGLAAYCYQPKKPSPDLVHKDLTLLSPTFWLVEITFMKYLYL